MIVDIDVTQDDIDEGGHSAVNCMIYLALRRVIHSGFRIGVLPSRFLIHPIGRKANSTHIFKGVKIYGFSKFVSTKIRLFDDFKPVTPFSFSQDIPIEFLNIEVPKFEQTVTA